MRVTSSRSLEGGGGGAHMAKLGRVELGWAEGVGSVIGQAIVGEDCWG